MKTLNDSQKKELESHRNNIDAAYADVGLAISAYNLALETASVDLQKSVDFLNARIADAQVFIEDVAHDIQAFQDNRSQKWHDSDAGQEHVSWGESWQITLEQLEGSIPEPLEPLIDFPAVDQLEQLPYDP